MAQSEFSFVHFILFIACGKLIFIWGGGEGSPLWHIIINYTWKTSHRHWWRVKSKQNTTRKPANVKCEWMSTVSVQLDIWDAHRSNAERFPFGTPNILIRFIEIFIKSFSPFLSSPFSTLRRWPFEAKIRLHFKHFLPFLFIIIHGWFINLSFLLFRPRFAMPQVPHEVD